MKESEEFVEATLRRTKTFGRAQVPLSYQSSSIPGRSEHVGHRLLSQRKTDVLMSRLHSSDIEFVTEPLRITPRHQSGTRRTTIGARHVSIRKANTFACEPIDVRRRDVLTSMHADIPVTHVVGDDDNDIGPLALSVKGKRKNGRAPGQFVWLVSCSSSLERNWAEGWGNNECYTGGSQSS